MIRNERKKKNEKNKNEDDDALKLAFVLSSASFQEAPFDSSLSSSSFFLSQRRRRGGRENEKTLLTFSSSSSSSDSSSWKEIRKKARERTGKDSACAICREEFATTNMSAMTTMDDDQNRGQVLTSCAHCFHAQCLKSFERFVESISERRRCPCCRTVGYRKIRISDARDECIRHAALTIQKMWRGRLVRNKLGPLTNENARMTWMANKLRALRKRVERSAEKRRETRNQQLAEEEEEEDIDESSSSDEDSNDTNTDWNVVIAKSLSLEIDECSICALRFAASKTNAAISSRRTDDSSPPTTTKVAYLSCSHRFHRNCLQTFERHLKSIGREIFCPCCRRANYSRKCL